MANEKLILGRYQPLGVAGSGGYGVVHVAWDPRIQRKVAIKTIQLSELDAYRARLPGADAIDFDQAPTVSSTLKGEGETVPALAHLPGLDEARTAALLQDPRIVTVYDFEVQGQFAYLIMEYVEGITLAHLLREYDDVLTLDIVAAVFEAIAGALVAAHKKGVLHLDIKPDNVLIDRQGQVKVTDFGLATLADITGRGTTGGGTIGYMPLEQMRLEKLDARCDEWSLAAVLYEMLTGANPFLARDLESAAAVIEDAELILPSLCWHDLDPELDDVIFYALDPDPAERYASVKDFAEEAAPFLGKTKGGTRQLALIVSDALGLLVENGDEDGEAGNEREEFWDIFGEESQRNSVINRTGVHEKRNRSFRISRRAKSFASRVFAFFGSGFISFVALVNLLPLLSASLEAVSLSASLESVPFALGGAAVVGVVGAVRAPSGALISLALFALSLMGSGALIIGGALLVATFVWWAFVVVGNKTTCTAAANTALSLPLCGAVGFASVTPLVAGACLKPRDAVLTTLLALVWGIVLGSLGSGTIFGWDAYANWRFGGGDLIARTLALLSDPGLWCVACGWVGAAFVEALCNRGQKRLYSFIGLVLAALLLVVSVAASLWLPVSTPSLFQIGISVIVPIVVVFLGLLLSVSDDGI